MRNTYVPAELRCFPQVGVEADTASQPQVRVHGAAVCAVFPLLPLSAAVIEHVDRERTRETRPSVSNSCATCLISLSYGVSRRREWSTKNLFLKHLMMMMMMMMLKNNRSMT